MTTGPLHPTIHYQVDHTFPHRKMTTRVGAARESYRCERQGEAPRDHFPTIEPGDRYLTVTLHPQEGLPNYRTIRLCSVCAVEYNLASYVEVDGVTATWRNVGAPPKRFRRGGEGWGNRPERPPR